jgi:2-dehydro-3-deoxyphosphogluconate aldolase/(4S)-4-hydroxy-2-oxoglutarate aldolase
MSARIEDTLMLAPVVPVVVVDDAADAVPLASALVAGGLPAIEVTLRTPAALDAIERIAEEVPGAVVGAGTVTSAFHAADAVAAGARFLVSPGATPALLDAMRGSGVPFLPGAATPSDVIALLERDVAVAKLFPAEAVGGVRTLRALAGPFPGMRFCPTGGIDLALAPSYLALPNVLCVGGSWMLPAAAVRERDWATVQTLAAAAAALGSPARPAPPVPAPG